ncbi:bifunctional oligoribonuclease/PAP phosphatase NrnA [Lysinibacillus sp. NPDC097195]|uniref:DHH family phosphoesterase n=1 Tax=Lysinibacillus sp. NPDC097195 TaxID=3364141 RepID=UPI003820FEA2
MKRQIIDTIASYETIVIHRHVRPDPDAYGSQLGLKELILANYPNKKVYAVGEHDTSLSFLAQPDQITDDVYENALVIVTDTANTERIDDQRYTKGKMLIKIDHHPNDDQYGDLLWVETTASSCSEMIYELFETGREIADWQLSDASARLLFAGIVGDTGRFQFPSTTVKTFKVAAELITYNFDRNEIFDGMYEMEPKLLTLQGYIYQNFKMDEHGAAYVKLTKELLAEYNAVPSEASLLVGCLGSVKGICAWVIFIEEEDQIRVRLRSKGPVINTLAKEFNGGGHPLASGATAYSWQEAERVISRLQEICKAYQ